uniref:Uncharacterized protein n=1 Tax=Romanomermis culicivorax TaxID=13658 RepID=A0A915I4A1_ROMCU
MCSQRPQTYSSQNGTIIRLEFQRKMSDISGYQEKILRHLIGRCPKNAPEAFFD